MVLRTEGLGGSAFFRVHAKADADRRLHALADEARGWVEFDGTGPREIDRSSNWSLG